MIKPTRFWLAITVIFGVLLIFSVYQTIATGVSPLPKRIVIGSISGVSTGTSETREDINNFVEEFNHINFMANIFTSCTLTISTGVAFYSFLESCKQVQN